MRTVRIDFTSENILPDGAVIGRMGEHNATDLVITPPAEMTECGEIVNYVAAFVTEGKIIRSDFYEKAEQITIPLCSQLTQDHSLSLQLEGYDGAGGLVVKSAIVSELTLLPSAGGDETDFDSENGGIVSQINLNTLARHEHSNKSLLDNFGEQNGVLTYNGETVGAQKTNVVELDVESGEAMAEASGSGINFYVCDYIFDSPPIADGAEIQRVEINTSLDGVDEWLDLRDMIKYDTNAPYVVNLSRAFYSGDVDGTYVSIVTFTGTALNRFYDAASNYQILKLRVTVAEDV